MGCRAEQAQAGRGEHRAPDAEHAREHPGADADDEHAERGQRQEVHRRSLGCRPGAVKGPPGPGVGAGRPPPLGFRRETSDRARRCAARGCRRGGRDPPASAAHRRPRCRRRARSCAPGPHPRCGPPAAPRATWSWPVLGARTGASYAAHRARRVFADAERRRVLDTEFELRTAEQVAEALGNMKGALMKVGQMASYLDQGLPEHVRATLAELQPRRAADERRAGRRRRRRGARGRRRRTSSPSGTRCRSPRPPSARSTGPSPARARPWRSRSSTRASPRRSARTWPTPG